MRSVLPSLLLGAGLWLAPVHELGARPVGPGCCSPSDLLCAMRLAPRQKWVPSGEAAPVVNAARAVEHFAARLRALAGPPLRRRLLASHLAVLRRWWLAG